jgi:hypothetical protein
LGGQTVEYEAMKKKFEQFGAIVAPPGIAGYSCLGFRISAWPG